MYFSWKSFLEISLILFLLSFSTYKLDNCEINSGIEVRLNPLKSTCLKLISELKSTDNPFKSLFPIYNI